MGTTLHTLAPNPGARHKKKRVGRGIGSGKGKTSGRGMKGQMARRQPTKPNFEGGQNPIHRRVPKRGFVNIFRIDVHGVNVALLEKNFEAGQEVTPETLHERGLVPKKAKVIKLLGTGDLKKKLVVKLHKASESAKAKVEGAGGSFELLAG